MTETLTLETELGTGLDDVEKTLVITRERLDEIQSWAESCQFDEEDMLDMAREEHFGDYIATREHFRETEDDVSIRTDDSLVAFTLSDFLEL